MSTKETAVKTEKVALIAGHKHAGEQLKAGDSIDVTETEKAWLIRHKIVAGPTDETGKKG